MKRIVLSLLFVGLIGGAGYLIYQQVRKAEAESRPQIRTDTAALRDLETVVNATGEVLPLLSSIVKSEISGRITVLHVDEGDAVQKGDLLIELDRVSLETRVVEAERSLEADRLRLQKAERNFQRLKQLYEKQFVGESDYLDAQTDYDLAKLTLDIAQTRLDEAKEDVAKTSIRAPHAGVVTLMEVTDGQVISGATSVSNGTDLLTVAELDELYMEADINEVDVELLRKCAGARVRFDALPDVNVDARVGKIALSAREETNDVRVFPIEVVFAATDERIRPGISATLEIPVASVEQAVTVLLSAVFKEAGESCVFVRSESGWEARRVEVGINDLHHVEVVSGLEAGETVALTRPESFVPFENN